jgi:hypothetical protein
LDQYGIQAEYTSVVFEATVLDAEAVAVAAEEIVGRINTMSKSENAIFLNDFI